MSYPAGYAGQSVIIKPILEKIIDLMQNWTGASGDLVWGDRVDVANWFTRDFINLGDEAWPNVAVFPTSIAHSYATIAGTRQMTWIVTVRVGSKEYLPDYDVDIMYEMGEEIDALFTQYDRLDDYADAHSRVQASKLIETRYLADSDGDFLFSFLETDVEIMLYRCDI